MIFALRSLVGGGEGRQGSRWARKQQTHFLWEAESRQQSHLDSCFKGGGSQVLEALQGAYTAGIFHWILAAYSICPSRLSLGTLDLPYQMKPIAHLVQYPLILNKKSLQVPSRHKTSDSSNYMESLRRLHYSVKIIQDIHTQNWHEVLIFLIFKLILTQIN